MCRREIDIFSLMFQKENIRSMGRRHKKTDNI